MSDSQHRQVPPQVIPQNVMLSVLNRCDDTREFLVEIWRSNPVLARQGGARVAMLLHPITNMPRPDDEFSHNP